MKVVFEKINVMQCFCEMINFKGKHITGLLSLLTQTALPVGASSRLFTNTFPDNKTIYKYTEGNIPKTCCGMWLSGLICLIFFFINYINGSTHVH